MKLYLSSYKLGNKPEELTKLIGNNTRVAIIMNAQDLVLPERRAMRVQEEIDALTALGLQPEELDLRDYFGKAEELANMITQYGALWVRGGNVFVLRRAMKQCGFDAVVIPLIRNEQLVYAGFSAGSAAATPDLRGIELVDDAEAVPEGYIPEKIWDCMNLVPYSIAPHYRSPHPESAAIEKVVQYFEANTVPYKTLHDGEAIVINGTDERIVG
jgi:dipeptidase E